MRERSAAHAAARQALDAATATWEKNYAEDPATRPLAAAVDEATATVDRRQQAVQEALARDPRWQALMAERDRLRSGG